jgi:deoxyribodipyrimidine photolyase-related protein
MDIAPMQTNESRLIVVLGDQLSLNLSALRAGNKSQDVVLLMEVWQEASYVKHHQKKIAFLFSAMRHFASELRELGWTVDYVFLDDPANTGSFSGEVARALDRHRAKTIVVTEAAEWRVQQDMQTWQARFNCDVSILEDDRFVASHEQFRRWAGDRKQLRMEYFYRDMRRKTGLLMDANQPAGGLWNFDSENRKKPHAGINFVLPTRFPVDLISSEVMTLVANRFSQHIGELEPFWFAVTRADANLALQHFLAFSLPQFGDYQDAMLREQKYLAHSVIAQYINCGLLDPLETCRAAEARFRSGLAPLNAVEGFIRQIIGWREYVRGIYWLHMPGYVERNFFNAQRALPSFYWTGNTKLACLHHVITQTIEEAYAHHIQRLMVTGNFAMLIGVNPHAVHEWYLAVYADAYEWVEAPNVIGMSQFADGGLLGSKPYAASGAYINKMSDYCQGCAFNVKEKSGPTACPFNYLYWDFLARNRHLLQGNPRLGPVYNVYDKFSAPRRQEIADDTAIFLSSL